MGPVTATAFGSLEIALLQQLPGMHTCHIFLVSIGIFPVGSVVELSTREIAQVVKLNPRLPMRPVVKIIYGEDGEAPIETKMFDLLTHTTVYIKKGLRKSEAHLDRR